MCHEMSFLRYPRQTDKQTNRNTDHNTLPTYREQTNKASKREKNVAENNRQTQFDDRKQKSCFAYQRLVT